MKKLWSDLFRRREAHRDLDEELRAHVALETQRRIDRGESPDAARLSALRELRSFDMVRENTQDAWHWRWFDELIRDVRLGLRSLGHERLFAASVTVILTLGIGASVMMFSVLNAVVLRPLPYARSHELARISTHLIQENQWDGTSVPNFLDWRQQSQAFTSLTFYRRTSVSSVTFSGGDAPQRAQEGLVGPEFFELLGVAPLFGRTFSRDEFDRKEKVVILSEGLWQEQFARSPAILGQSMTIDGASHAIIGIMPQSFQLPTGDTRLWRPLAAVSYWPAAAAARASDGFEVIGRLAPGVRLEDAKAEMAVVASRLRVAYAANRNFDIRVESLFDFVVGSRTCRGVWLAFAAVLSLLFITCANVGGMLLARTAKRRPELALRTVLGAGQLRLVRQVLAESVSLWILASASAMATAYGLIRLLLIYGPRSLPRLSEVRLDFTGIAVSLAGSLVVVIACGSLPALAAWRVNAGSTFAARDQKTLPKHQLQDALVSAQIAGTLMLLVIAVLLAQSFVRAQHEEPGYPAENLLIVRIDVPRIPYPDRQALEGFFRDARTRLGSLPGVVDVGGMTDFFIRRNAGQWVTLKDRPLQKDTNSRLAVENVTPGYFHAMGIEVIQGRDFEERDYDVGASGVFIVSEALARRFWPGENPIGKSLVTGETPPSDGRWSTVVGVVRDIRRESLDVAPIMLGFAPSFMRGMDLTVRASTDVDNLIPAVRRELRAIDSALPVTSIIPASVRLSDRLGQRRFETQVLVVFAVIALVLSAAGLYALLAYQVTLRSREIGIRAALGAQRGSIVAMIVGKGLRLTTVGAVIGIAGAVSTAAIIQSLLYETAAIHVWSYLGVVVFVFVVAVTASWFPAHRASRTDPMNVLRI